MRFNERKNDDSFNGNLLHDTRTVLGVTNYQRKYQNLEN